MMRALYKQQGAQMDITILADDEVQQFIDTHADALNGSFSQVKMSDTMRQRLERSNWVFSGMKTFHELNESFPSLLDENGDRKPFERFLNDVRKVDETYNSNYLRAEYNFIHASAAMAAKWEQYQEDGDRYYLQYRTAGDDRVRPEHAALEGVTLPMDDPFWEEYYPPNGWNCRCTVVQVRKSKYPKTDHDEAMRLGELATGQDTRGMFHFNPGKQQKAIPDYNPYTISQCRTCDVARGDGGKEQLAAFIPQSDLCQACNILRAVNAADAKQVRMRAKKTIQGKELRNAGFNHKVVVRGSSIKEWTNQPHNKYRAKNRALLDIKNLFYSAKYLGCTDNHKSRKDVVQSHVFECEIAGEASYILVFEYTWGEYVLHSVSDSPNIVRFIKKK